LTSKRASHEDAYYFAGNERIPLELESETVGVLLDHPAVETMGLRRQLERLGSQLRAGIVIVPASVVPTEVRERLDVVGAILPVYVHDDSHIVVLPEVRVEGHDRKEIAAIRKFLDTAEVEPGDIEEHGTRVTVRPQSGRAADALRLANQVHERVNPPLSQARFLRIVKKR
jgi:hypothetical protein